MKRHSAVISLGFAAALVGAVSGCSRSQGTPAEAHVPSVQGPAIAPGAPSQIVRLSNGADIIVRNFGGKPYFQVEGTYTQEAWADFTRSYLDVAASERDLRMDQELRRAFARINEGTQAIAFDETPRVAYFTFYMPYSQDLMAPLKGRVLGRAMSLSPVVVDRDSIRNDRALTPEAEGLVPQGLGRGGLESFSGLRRIGAPDFVAKAEADIGGGAKVNGSSVKLGATDTGITYNHPTFMSADGTRNRIAYLKDFTREGRVYFNEAAKFEVIAPTGAGADDLVVNAQIIATPKLPDLPAGDQFTDVSNLQIKVSPELKAILTAPDHGGAKLGILFEDVMSGEEDKVDLNANGKTDDKFYMILLPRGADGHGDPVVFFDKSGTGDFRTAKPLADWNKNHDTISIVAEKAGFDIETDKLPKASGDDTVAVISASIVGFDPGNHGSHVSGIAAGSHTLLNSPTDTLARGVAPDANIYMNRVCANNGGCNATQAFIDLVLNGSVDVINMSLGGLNPFNDGYGTQETLINRLTQMGNVLFVISAGNSGPGHQTIGSPSTARLSLSVGASASKGLIQRQYEWPGAGPLVDAEGDTDFMLFFSSRGPTAAGGFKPNVAAPGTELSSVQLNSAPGAHAGLDVYWGTSMAAPTATGSYALFLDAVRKYNAAHPDHKLPSDTLTLRQAIIDSARPFDVSSLDVETGAKTSGRYTWVDEGKGMIDLPSAWRHLFELRDSALPATVRMADGTPVNLDYQVIVQAKNPSGQTYDGSRAAAQGQPALGTGLYIDYNATETLRPVFIARRLPEGLASGPEAGELARQLETTAEEFVLKTRIYGSDKVWLKAGVKDQLDCMSSDTANLTLLGRAVDVAVNADGTANVAALNASVLNVCLDREMIRNQLPQGDNGALIEGYRVVDGKVATAPSFTVPVYVTVPHKTLANSTGYETEQTVRSFDVSRNYVYVPRGTSVVRITLEVPALKLQANGLPERGESCSGVELMALLGNNSLAPFKARKDARIANCDATGAPVTDPAKRTLTFNATDPNPGLYDVHVFASYKYAVSKFKLRVDYVTAETSLAKIEGDESSLSGTLSYTVKESSLSVGPDSAKSSLDLSGLFSSAQAKVQAGDHVFVQGALGTLRAYPAETKSVTITTGGSPGNDIDLTVVECPKAATSAGDAACAPAGQSGGPTDQESVTFKPKADKVYAARVDGYDVKDEGKFTSTETVTLETEKGTVAVSGTAPSFQISYALTSEQVAASKLLKNELFTSGKVSVTGALVIRAADETVLHAVPVTISRPAPAPAAGGVSGPTGAAH